MNINIQNNIQFRLNYTAPEEAKNVAHTCEPQQILR